MEGDRSFQRAWPGIDRGTLIFVLMAVAYFLSQFFRSANAVISRDLTQELSLSAAQLGLMTSFFYAAFALVQLPLGTGLDRFGARRVTPALMMVGAVGSLAFAMAHTFPQLIVGRALIGVGMAGILMGSYKLFSQWFPVERFAGLSGLLVALGALGALSAGTPLAWASQAWGWRTVFVAGAAATAISAVSIVVGARDTPSGALPHTQRVASRGGMKRVMRSTVFWRIALLDFFVVGPMLSVQGLWGGPFLFDVAGFSTARVGDLLTLLSIGALCGYLVSGALGNRVGIQRMAFRGAVLFALAEVGLVAIALGAGSQTLLWIVYPLFGFAGGFNILLMAHARTAFPTHMTGRAVTAVNFFGIGGVAVLQWVMGLIIDSYGRDAAGHYPPEAYAAAFGLAAVGTIVAVGWYATLRRR